MTSFRCGPKPSAKVAGYLKYIRKTLKIRGDVTIEHLLGKRVNVYWSGRTGIRAMEVCRHYRP